MSFATSIGHVHLPGGRAAARTVTPAVTPATAPEPRRVRSTISVDAAVSDHRRELQQWSTSYTLAVCLNR